MGMPNFEALQTEYFSLTDAIEHIEDTKTSSDSSNHQIEARIVEEK